MERKEYQTKLSDSYYSSVGVHPLFLGLQHSKSYWLLKQFPLDEEIEKLSKLLAEKPIVKKKAIW